MRYDQTFDAAAPTIEDIPTERWKEFGDRVMKAGGRAVVLVHPFYEPTNPEYERTMTKLIERSKVPVIMLLGRNQWYDEKWRKNRHGNIVYIPTGDATPSTLTRDRHGDVKPERSQKTLIERLKQLGVRRVLMGGMYSWHEQLIRGYEQSKPIAAFERKKRKGHGKENFKQNIISDGCLGETYYRFIVSKAFHDIVLIPNALFPDKPPYYLSRSRRFSKKPLEKSNPTQKRGWFRRPKP